MSVNDGFRASRLSDNGDGHDAYGIGQVAFDIGDDETCNPFDKMADLRYDEWLEGFNDAAKESSQFGAGA